MVEKFAHIENDMSQYAFWSDYIEWRAPMGDDDPDSYGDVFVLATDYAALEAERDEWKRRCEAAEEDAQSWHDALDMLAAGMGEAIAASIAEGRDNE